jgi:hypothetical protein
VLCPNELVRIRRIARAAATIMVAIVVALAVPVSQLRTRTVVKTWCCCPDPSHCHCPDHKVDRSTQPKLRACHDDSHVVVAPVLPVFEAPELAIDVAPQRALVAIAPAIDAPHPAPAPRRPDAPS